MTGASEATQDICPDCCGTGGGHPDNLAGKCYRCDGTGGIPKTTEDDGFYEHNGHCWVPARLAALQPGMTLRVCVPLGCLKEGQEVDVLMFREGQPVCLCDHGVHDLMKEADPQGVLDCFEVIQ